jgi:hypothetical protein
MSEHLVLNDRQAGHLRRMIDLSEQLPDDWSGMMGRSTMQEDFSALRFQLAYMSYALALTHVHRLPAAPAVFKTPFDNLIQKIMSPDVWTYWHYVSTGNGPYNKALGELPPQWNPVETDNIMYSAYVQSMALLYHYLFNDPKYAEEGGLTFKLQPLFWGAGGKRFVYDEKSLTQQLYWTMVEKGYLGIACEPNCIFQVCNQPAILGYRMHDFLYGGNIAEEVTEGYKRAWEEFGILDSTGHFNIVLMERERQLVQRAPVAWADFWLGTLMHMWDPDGVANAYKGQIAEWARQGPGDSLWIHPTLPRHEGGPDISNALDFGWAAACASEVGDEETVRRLVAYADTCLTPVSDNGSYYYRRRDGWLDDEGKLHAMDPHTGNVLLGYAHLNVPGGLSKLYADGLDPDWHKYPALVEMTPGLDIRTAYYDRGDGGLNLVFRPGRIAKREADLTISNVWDRRPWRLLIDSQDLAAGDGMNVTSVSGPLSAARQGDALIVRLPVGDQVSLRLELAA